MMKLATAVLCAAIGLHAQGQFPPTSGGSATPTPGSTGQILVTDGAGGYGTSLTKNAANGPVVLNSSGNAAVGTTLPAGAPAGTVGASIIYSPNSALNCRAFGATGDGSTDDTASIQACLDAGSAPRSVYFPTPSACYKIMSLSLNSNTTLLGPGLVTSGTNGGLCSYSTTQDALSAIATGNTGLGKFEAYESGVAEHGSRNIHIRNLTITDAVRATRTSGNCITVDGTSDSAQVDLQDDYCFGFEDGFFLGDPIKSNLIGTRSTSALVNAYEVRSTSTSTNFTGTYADAPGQYGYYATNITYSSFNGTACDNSGSDCYRIDSGDGGTSHNLTFNAAGTENPVGNGFYFDAYAIVLNSPVATGIPVGTGKAPFTFNHAANVTVNNPYVRGGDYGLNVQADNSHQPAQFNQSICLNNPTYILTFGINVINDSVGAINGPGCTMAGKGFTPTYTNLHVSAAATPAAPTVSYTGTAGSSTWGYKAEAVFADGTHSAASAEQTVGSAAATLTSANFPTATTAVVANSVYCNVYRSTAATSPATTGLIGKVICGAALNDKALTAGAAPDGTNTTGTVTIPALKSTTGTRYVCVDTSGNMTSSASACSGT